jgi:hypothetical protein
VTRAWLGLRYASCLPSGQVLSDSMSGHCPFFFVLASREAVLSSAKRRRSGMRNLPGSILHPSVFLFLCFLAVDSHREPCQGALSGAAASDSTLANGAVFKDVGELAIHMSPKEGVDGRRTKACCLDCGRSCRRSPFLPNPYYCFYTHKLRSFSQISVKLIE